MPTALVGILTFMNMIFLLSCGEHDRSFTVCLILVYVLVIRNSVFDISDQVRLKDLNSETIKMVPLPDGFSRHVKGYSI